jgi:5-methylcytosine-specific restriction enzyme subunit McrC
MGWRALFARAARQAVTRGLLRSYRRVDRDEAVIRGRIRWNQQARRQAPVPIALRYDVHDDDTAENQVLRATLAVLRRGRVQRTGTANAIARLWREFRHVSELWDPLTAVDRVRWTRHNAAFRRRREVQARGGHLEYSGCLLINASGDQGAVQLPDSCVRL